mmetsp:Transcript_2235/g.5295  ORF Transcript_2235/g.5295 Transcript_2235/m.5295 type:complete len:205 (-) Transcript_2235:4989-5603(-)
MNPDRKGIFNFREPAAHTHLLCVPRLVVHEQQLRNHLHVFHIGRLNFFFRFHEPSAPIVSLFVCLGFFRHRRQYITPLHVEAPRFLRRDQGCVEPPVVAPRHLHEVPKLLELAVHSVVFDPVIRLVHQRARHQAHRGEGGVQNLSFFFFVILSHHFHFRCPPRPRPRPPPRPRPFPCSGRNRFLRRPPAPASRREGARFFAPEP